MKRTFIYCDNKSNKFWSIEVNGCQFTVNYGKVGTDGQTQTKEFDSEEKCQKEAEKLIAEKTKKGYVEQGETPLVSTEGKDSKLKSTKKYNIFVNAYESESDKEDGDDDYMLEVIDVDLHDTDCIVAALKAFTKKINDEDFREECESSGAFTPVGMVKNNVFTMYGDYVSNSYQVFFNKAAELNETRPELEKLCKKIIKINNENGGCPTWETGETLLGVSPAFALAMFDKKYIALATDMMCSMNNGDHTTPSDVVINLFNKWGACPETLKFGVAYITAMPMQDIGGAEYDFIETFKEYFKNEKNINLFLKTYAEYVEDSHSNTTDLFKQIFSDKDYQTLASNFLDLVDNGETPTFKKITETKQESTYEEKEIESNIQFPSVLDISLDKNFNLLVNYKSWSEEKVDGFIFITDGKTHSKYMPTAEDAIIEGLKIVKGRLTKGQKFECGETMLNGKMVDITNEQLNEWLSAIPNKSFYWDLSDYTQNRKIVKAVREGKIDVLKQYISSGLNVTEELRESKNKIYLLDAAIDALQPGMIRYISGLHDNFIKNGMPPSEYSFFTFIANDEDDDKRIDKLRAMLTNGYDIKKDPCIISHYSSFDLPQDMLDYLINNIDFNNIDGDTIYRALSSGNFDKKHPERILQLIDKGIYTSQSPAIKNFEGSTPLHFAVHHYGNSMEVIKKLIEKGAGVNAKDRSGESALESAFKGASTLTPEVAVYLYKLTQNFKPNLHSIVSKFSENPEVVKLLLNENTDYTQEFYGMDILAYLKRMNIENKEIVEFLTQKLKQ